MTFAVFPGFIVLLARFRPCAHEGTQDAMTTLNFGFSRMRHDDAGAVPGWLLVTAAIIGVAILVTVAWVIAGGAIGGVLQQGIGRIVP